ncbi:uncharacterized protein MELLADRAFT_111188 [Melampsora larici-populina 98AG31]|uniref:Uncharacterized protein n=1 Tax=Melampsora larici-populina (strain 98AG31 / pathotype 3-4-7) TaxID=747676 RepID=F4S2B3_MELLP|nr:uncharacterized protein MELLADRAFT_111188 [Melampsora larici-populina 98AG31]EGG01234.1 hypothetical protein MELLADRAFT_111188 [Melampsora larici-populina 98AG31]
MSDDIRAETIGDGIRETEAGRAIPDQLVNLQPRGPPPGSKNANSPQKTVEEEEVEEVETAGEEGPRCTRTITGATGVYRTRQRTQAPFSVTTMGGPMEGTNLSSRRSNWLNTTPIPSGLSVSQTIAKPTGTRGRTKDNKAERSLSVTTRTERECRVRKEGRMWEEARMQTDQNPAETGSFDCNPKGKPSYVGKQK